MSMWSGHDWRKEGLRRLLKKFRLGKYCQVDHVHDGREDRIKKDVEATEPNAQWRGKLQQIEKDGGKVVCRDSLEDHNPQEKEGVDKKNQLHTKANIQLRYYRGYVFPYIPHYYLP